MMPEFGNVLEIVTATDPGMVRSYNEDKDIHAALGSLRSNLPLAAQQLVQLANDSGGSDNISVILVRVLD